MPGIIVPDAEWYEFESQSKKVAASCPYADGEKCLRFFDTQYELETIKPDAQETKRLTHHWKSKRKAYPFPNPSVQLLYKGKTYRSLCPEVARVKFEGLNFEEVTLSVSDGETTLGAEIYSILENKNDFACIPSAVIKNIKEYHPLHYSDCELFLHLSGPKTISRSETISPHSESVTDTNSTRIRILSDYRNVEWCDDTGNWIEFKFTVTQSQLIELLHKSSKPQHIRIIFDELDLKERAEKKMHKILEDVILVGKISSKKFPGKAADIGS